jgi:aspartate racemase
MLSRIEIDNSGDRAAGQIAVGLESDALPAGSFGCEAVRRRPDADPAPLSFAEERLWFLNQINPDDVSSNISRAFRIKGPLDTERLNQAFKTIVARHESLRTTFARNELRAGVDSRPMRLIKERGSTEPRLLDLCHLTGSEREQKTREIARDEAQRPFDLTLGPLWRFTLLRLGDRDAVLLLNTHRIVCDEFSIGIFFDELWQCYRSLSSNGRPQVDLRIQYADYAAWQRAALEGGALEKQLAYWRTKLEGAPAAIELPADRVRPAIQSWQGASTSIVLPKSLAHELRDLSAREDTTLFVIFLAAFQLLITRYSRQTDVVVGSEFEARDDEKAARLIGPVANVLPLRVDLSGNPTFRELLKRVGATVAEVRENHSVPFEKLLEVLNVERSLSHAPLFQTTLNWRRSSAADDEFSGLQIENFDYDAGIAQFDLTLDITEKLECRLEYNTDLFERETAERMAGHFRTLLSDIAFDPDQRIQESQLLTAEEQRQLLCEWNPATPAFETELCIHELLSAGARRNPLAQAVLSGEQRLTYQELESRSNQLASYLRKYAVGAEVPVAVCLERSVELIVSLLAVMKSGGAYVPLDPTYPTERLTFMLEDSRAPVLITQKSLLGSLPQRPGSIVLLDGDKAKISNESDAPPQSSVTPDNIAYIIYTSGSTGRPKGVEVTHKTVVHLFAATRDKLGFQEQETWTTVHSSAFDFSVWEIWGALLQGGRLVVVPREVIQSPPALLDLLRREQVSILSATPSALRQLLEARQQSGPARENWAVRQIICGGDALDQELALELLRLGIPVWNFYGPTESTVWTTLAEIEPGTAGDELTSIGRPIAGLQAYLLSDQLQPVPIGVPGELYIAGDGLARGYSRRPALTAERFLANPFSRLPGARMYRTGDLCRFRRNGKIEFLGRLDTQVKLRGFRIELGEIEAVLSEHPDVRQAVVIIREDRKDDKRLVAYLVPAGSQLPAVSELREHAQRALPDYMVPAVFVSLPTLPLTPNRKVDRSALPPPPESRLDLTQNYIAPRDNTEEQLTRLWETVLGVKSVGIRDNFFELGGHSLLAARLFAQIENRFARNLPLATLFQAPTIEQLAAVLTETESTHSWASLVPIQPNGSKPPLFCIHACGPHVFIYRPLVRHLNGNQPVYGLQAQGIDGQREPFTRIADMAAHYIKEIREFQPHGPYYLLGDTLAGLFALEMAQQLVEQGEEVGLLAMIDTFCPLRPSLGRRFACHLIHLRELGIGNYVLAGARAVRNRLARKITKDVANPYAQTTEVEAARQASDTDDPLVKTEWAIYKAAYLNYSPPTKVFPGRIVYFLAEDAPYASRYEDNRRTWKRLAGRGLEVFPVPGRHDTVKEEPHVAKLAEKLTACLERAEQERQR